jgi:hypothetical protein
MTLIDAAENSATNEISRTLTEVYTEHGVPTQPRASARERDTITAAWIATLQMEGSSLAPHLIPRTFGSPAEPEPRTRKLRLIIRGWKTIRRDCYLVLGSLVVGIIIASLFLQK